MAKKTANEVDDVMRELGVDPAEAVSLNYEIWAPWKHEEHPKGIRGIYGGYKIATKAMGADENIFELFYIDAQLPKPKMWLVASSFQLEELKRVRPGTEVVIVFSHSERNRHGGESNHVKWVFFNKVDKNTCVATRALPAINETQRQLSASSQGFSEDNPDA